MTKKKRGYDAREDNSVQELRAGRRAGRTALRSAPRNSAKGAVAVVRHVEEAVVVLVLLVSGHHAVAVSVLVAKGVGEGGMRV